MTGGGRGADWPVMAFIIAVLGAAAGGLVAFVVSGDPWWLCLALPVVVFLG